jgi:putative ABC transport system permease protein
VLSHYLAVALRNFARYPLHTGLTIAVLALGLVCFIAAALFVLHLDSFDRQFPSSDRIYVVYQSSEWPANGVSMALAPSAALPVAEQLKIDIPELAGVARFLLSGAMVSVDEAEATFRRVAYVDADWLDIFQLDVVAGDANGALARPRTAIVTQEAATQLFGTIAAVGRTLSMTDQGNRTEVTIAAVVADIPAPSHLANGQFSVSFEILGSWDVFEATYSMMNQRGWVFPAGTTYALLPEDGSLMPSSFNARLQAFGERTLPEAGAKVAFEARHVSRFTKDQLQRRIQGQGVQSGGSLPMQLSSILLLLGGLILGIACLNFINLTTARSAARAREVGVRKSLGATAGSVVRQDLVQTAVTVFVAIALALFVIWALGRALEDRWQVVMSIPWSTPGFWLLFAGVLVLVTGLAGLYPAIVLARVNPVSALRLGTMKVGPQLLRALLVGVQFASAAFLGLAVTVVYLQTNTLREAALGRFGDPYVVLNPGLRGANRIDFELLAAELARGLGIRGVAGISSYPWQSGGVQQPLRRLPDEQMGSIMTEMRYITYDYFSLMDTPLLAGRWFAKDRADDALPQSREESESRSSPVRVVLDRRAASALGWPNPETTIGELVYFGNNQQPMEIIGVVESLPLALRNRGNNSIIFWLAPQFASTTLVRVASADVTAALEHIDGVWKDLAPDTRIFRQFLDESFEQAYWAFNVANRVVVGLAIFAIVIAAIGLFGMASFMTRRRTREIGLRKSQGATSAQILRLLLWDFSKPVLVANLAVWPLAYVAARAYLDLFIERMTLTPLPFLVMLVATLLIAWIVVGVQVVCAARLNPTIALRHE